MSMNEPLRPTLFVVSLQSPLLKHLLETLDRSPTYILSGWTMPFLMYGFPMVITVLSVGQCVDPRAVMHAKEQITMRYPVFADCDVIIDTGSKQLDALVDSSPSTLAQQVWMVSREDVSKWEDGNDEYISAMCTDWCTELDMMPKLANLVNTTHVLCNWETVQCTRSGSLAVDQGIDIRHQLLKIKETPRQENGGPPALASFCLYFVGQYTSKYLKLFFNNALLARAVYPNLVLRLHIDSGAFFSSGTQADAALFAALSRIVMLGNVEISHCRLPKVVSAAFKEIRFPIHMLHAARLYRMLPLLDVTDTRTVMYRDMDTIMSAHELRQLKLLVGQSYTEGSTPLYVTSFCPRSKPMRPYALWLLYAELRWRIGSKYDVPAGAFMTRLKFSEDDWIDAFTHAFDLIVTPDTYTLDRNMLDVHDLSAGERVVPGDSGPDEIFKMDTKVLDETFLLYLLREYVVWETAHTIIDYSTGPTLRPGDNVYMHTPGSPLEEDMLAHIRALTSFPRADIVFDSVVGMDVIAPQDQTVSARKMFNTNGSNVFDTANDAWNNYGWIATAYELSHVDYQVFCGSLIEGAFGASVHTVNQIIDGVSHISVQTFVCSGISNLVNSVVSLNSMQVPISGTVYPGVAYKRDLPMLQFIMLCNMARRLIKHGHCRHKDMVLAQLVASSEDQISWKYVEDVKYVCGVEAGCSATLPVFHPEYYPYTGAELTVSGMRDWLYCTVKRRTGTKPATERSVAIAYRHWTLTRVIHERILSPEAEARYATISKLLGSGNHLVMRHVMFV